MASSLDAIILEKGPDILKRLEERSSVAQIIEPEKFDKFAILSEILGYTAKLIGARYIGITEIRLVPEIGKELQHIDDGVFYNKERFLALAHSIDETLSNKEKLNVNPLFYQQVAVYWYAPDCEVMEEGEEMIGPIEPKKFSQMRGTAKKLYDLKETFCLCKNKDYMTKLLLDDTSESKFKNFDDYLIFKLKDYVSIMPDLGKPVNPEKIDYGIALSEFKEFINGLNITKRYSSQQMIDFNYVLRSNSSIAVPIIAFDATNNEEVVLGNLDIGDIPGWDLEPLSSEAMEMLGKIAGKVAPSIAQAYQAHQWKVINEKLKEAQEDLLYARALSRKRELAEEVNHQFGTLLLAAHSAFDEMLKTENPYLSIKAKIEKLDLSLEEEQLLAGIVGHIKTQALVKRELKGVKKVLAQDSCEKTLRKHNVPSVEDIINDYVELQLDNDDEKNVFSLIPKYDSSLIIEFLSLENIRAKSSTILDTSLRSMNNLSRALKEYSIEKKANNYNIYQGIENTIMVMSARLAGITVHSDQPQKPLPLIECYPGFLVQVLTNIIDNAKEAGAKNIYFNAYEIDQSHIGVRVSNDGPQIPKDVMEKIFISRYTTKEKGSGIGLNFAKKVIEEMHKGKITTYSDSKTTYFEIMLPYKLEA